MGKGETHCRSTILQLSYSAMDDDTKRTVNTMRGMFAALVVLGFVFYRRSGTYELKQVNCTIVDNTKTYQVGIWCHYDVTVPADTSKTYSIRENDNQCVVGSISCYEQYDDQGNFAGVRYDNRSPFQWKIV